MRKKLFLLLLLGQLSCFGVFSIKQDISDGIFDAAKKLVIDGERLKVIASYFVSPSLLSGLKPTIEGMIDEYVKRRLTKENGEYDYALAWSDFKGLCFKTSLYVVGLPLASYFLYKAGSVSLNYIQALLLNKKPKIFTKHYKARSYFQRLKEKLFGRQAFDMVFDESIVERLDEIIAVTNAIYSRKINAPFNNILLYGKPGTGKTMFARYLAHMTGMEYVETTGGAFLQDGAGIEAVNAMFDYAHKTSGLLVFIDEADSLFVDRNELSVGANARKYEILNHLLNRLGEPNNKLMLVCATNHPVVFDEAMSRRFAEAIEMPLPDLQARIALFELYIAKAQKTLKNFESSFAQMMQQVFNSDYASLAGYAEGMSGSDIATIIRNFANAFALHMVQGKSGKSFDGQLIMEQKIAQYRVKMKALGNDSHVKAVVDQNQAVLLP